MTRSELEDLKTTDSGTIRKKDAMDWLQKLDEADIPESVEDDLIKSVVPKPDDHSGSAFPTTISQVRITGRPEFIKNVARLFKWFNTWESSATRLAINLQKIEDRDSGELTENYALYLSTAMRGTQGAISNGMLGNHSDEDERLLEALEKAENIE
jgi:hypothetical protein